MRFLATLLIAILAFPLIAADAKNDSATQKAIDDFKSAMQGDDATNKKLAISALASKSIGDDDTILPMLIQAVGDRQGSEAAIAALRARTGLSPSPHQGVGGYPGYPVGDSVEQWQAWLTARTADREKEKKLDEALKDAKEAKQAAKGSETVPGGEVTGKSTGEKPKVAVPEDSGDLGKMDRITLKTGGSLLCYILTKRIDSDGNLLSVRIMHQDQGGEETLPADLIAHIDEDIE